MKELIQVAVLFVAVAVVVSSSCVSGTCAWYGYQGWSEWENRESFLGVPDESLCLTLKEICGKWVVRADLWDKAILAYPHDMENSSHATQHQRYPKRVARAALPALLRTVTLVALKPCLHWVVLFCFFALVLLFR